MCFYMLLWNRPPGTVSRDVLPSGSVSSWRKKLACNCFCFYSLANTTSGYSKWMWSENVAVSGNDGDGRGDCRTPAGADRAAPWHDRSTRCCRRRALRPTPASGWRSAGLLFGKGARPSHRLKWLYEEGHPRQGPGFRSPPSITRSTQLTDGPGLLRQVSVERRQDLFRHQTCRAHHHFYLEGKSRAWSIFPIRI